MNVIKPHAFTTDTQKDLSKNTKKENNEKGFKTSRNKMGVVYYKDKSHLRQELFFY